MSKHRHIYLEKPERVELEQLLDGSEASVREKKRANILLLSDRSQGAKRTLQEIADIERCSRGMVVNVRRRYLDDGMEAALYDNPRPGAQRKISGDVEAKMTLLACSDPPAGQARWSLRLLADELVRLEIVESISHTTVGETLKKRS